MVPIAEAKQRLTETKISKHIHASGFGPGFLNANGQAPGGNSMVGWGTQCMCSGSTLLKPDPASHNCTQRDCWEKQGGRGGNTDCRVAEAVAEAVRR